MQKQTSIVKHGLSWITGPNMNLECPECGARGNNTNTITFDMVKFKDKDTGREEVFSACCCTVCRCEFIISRKEENNEN